MLTMGREERTWGRLDRRDGPEAELRRDSKAGAQRDGTTCQKPRGSNWQSQGWQGFSHHAPSLPGGGQPQLLGSVLHHGLGWVWFLFPLCPASLKNFSCYRVFLCLGFFLQGSILLAFFPSVF